MGLRMLVVLFAFIAISCAQQAAVPRRPMPLPTNPYRASLLAAVKEMDTMRENLINLLSSLNNATTTNNDTETIRVFSTVPTQFQQIARNVNAFERRIATARATIVQVGRQAPAFVPNAQRTPDVELAVATRLRTTLRTNYAEMLRILRRGARSGTYDASGDMNWPAYTSRTLTESLNPDGSVEVVVSGTSGKSNNAAAANWRELQLYNPANLPRVNSVRVRRFPGVPQRPVPLVNRIRSFRGDLLASAHAFNNLRDSIEGLFVRLDNVTSERIEVAQVLQLFSSLPASFRNISSALRIINNRVRDARQTVRVVGNIAARAISAAARAAPLDNVANLVQVALNTAIEGLRTNLRTNFDEMLRIVRLGVTGVSFDAAGNMNFPGFQTRTIEEEINPDGSRVLISSRAAGKSNNAVAQAWRDLQLFQQNRNIANDIVNFMGNNRNNNNNNNRNNNGPNRNNNGPNRNNNRNNNNNNNNRNNVINGNNVAAVNNNVAVNNGAAVNNVADVNNVNNVVGVNNVNNVANVAVNNVANNGVAQALGEEDFVADQNFALDEPDFATADVDPNTVNNFVNTFEKVEDDDDDDNDDSLDVDDVSNEETNNAFSEDESGLVFESASHGGDHDADQAVADGYQDSAFALADFAVGDPTPATATTSASSTAALSMWQVALIVLAVFIILGIILVLVQLVFLTRA